jgi:hypothetical protein
MWNPNSELHAVIVERFNKTLQRALHQHMTENMTERYIPFLQRIVDSYNDKPHRSLGGYTPNQADNPAMENIISTIHNDRYSKLLHKKSNVTFKVGDTVRIKTGFDNRFHRSYNEQFSRELFEIIRVDYHQPKPMYELRSLDRGDIINGEFYSNDLQLVLNPDNVFKLSVIGERVRRGRREYLIKYYDFSDRHNQWVDADEFDRNDLVRDYRPNQ